MEHKPGFWSSLPGILTGLAALVTALTGLYLALRDDLPTMTDDPVVVDSPLADIAGDAIAIAPPGDDTDQGGARETAAGAPGLRPLLDCTNPLYQTTNTIRSLLSWSDYYHDQIAEAGNLRARALYPCQQALGYRSQAHCSRPDDLTARQALQETLDLCRKAGVTLDDLPGTADRP